MFIKNYQIMFFGLLISGTMIAVSANSWFTSWLGLEINLMSMIPLMLISLNSKTTEASIKYFLAQAMASIILIFSVAMNFYSEENVSLGSLEIFIILALIIKAGMAPFHTWFPQVSNNLSWPQCLLIFTWQKIAPLILLSSFKTFLIFIVAIITAVVGSLSGFNQTILKLILTYSSVSHSGWMLTACLLSFYTWSFYFLVYSFLSLAIITFFMSNQTKFISQIFTSSDSYFSKFIISMNLMSLGGLPPLLGFSAKLTILIILIKNFSILLFIPLIFSSLISLFFYTRCIYSNLMNLNKNNIFNKSLINKKMLMFSALSIVANTLVSSLIILT